ncbi:MAG: F0F1 ATP synthase subunit B [Caldilineaceae bacterium]|nr:F0F1 ATP synthase subunit B [Caldilineaceae bacterium]
MSAVLGQLGIEGGLLVSQIVNFLILIVILRVTLYQPILNMLEQRRQRIAQSMKDAERASAAAREAEHDKTKVLEEARREAQEVRAQATRDAEKIAQEIRARAEQEATEIRRKAQADALAQAESALAGANKQIADLAILATQQILGRELANRSEQERFVAEFLDQQGRAA